MLLTSVRSRGYRFLESSFLPILRSKLGKNIIFYWFLLHFVGSFVVPSAPGYTFIPSHLILFSFAIEVFFLLVVLKLIPTEINGPLDVLQVFTAFFLTIPVITVTFTNNSLSPFTNFIALIYIIIFQFLIFFLRPKNKIRPLHNSILPFSEVRILFFLIFISLILASLIINSNDFNFHISSLNSLYVYRNAYLISLQSSENPLLGYAFGWLGGILAPTIFLLGIHLRRYYAIFFSIILGVFVYAGAAQKWILASYFFILLVFLLQKKNYKFKLATFKIFSGINSIIIMILIWQSCFYNSRIADLGIRRALLDPAIMMQYYVQFTRDYPLRFWQDTKFGQLFFQNHSDTAARTIGDRYFHLPQHFYLLHSIHANATAGAVADSVSEAGIFGLFFTTGLILLFFFLLERLSMGKNSVFIICISALVVEMLVEGTLHTLLLTRGLILVPIIFYLLPTDNLPASALNLKRNAADR